MNSITKKVVFLLSACLVVMLSIIPCFATRGDITWYDVKGMWELKYSNVTDYKVTEDWNFICTEGVANSLKRGSKPFQVMTDSPNIGYASIWIILNDGESQRQAVAHYKGDIGTRGFCAIELGYTYPYKDQPIVGQKCTLSWITLANYGEYTSSGEIQIVDYLMVMLDYANVQWSKNLDYIDFGEDWGDIIIDPQNKECENIALKAFGTNAFGGAVLNTGAFVPIGEDPVPPATDTMQSFVDLVFNTLTNILSIEFFGWFSIGTLVAVFVAISAVLLFLKYFAGG